MADCCGTSRRMRWAPASTMRRTSSSSSTPAKAPADCRAAATGAASGSTACRPCAPTASAGAHDPTTACSASTAWRASTSRCLLLRERSAELAVAVEQHLHVAVLHRAGDVHRAAAAEIGLGLEQAAGVLGRLEVALRTAFLLEQALHAVALDGDVDHHLVGRAFGATGNIRAVTRPGIGGRLGLGRAREQEARDRAGKNNNLRHRNSLPSEVIPDRLEHGGRLLLSDCVPGI